jgi:hypothetical protein
MVFWRRVFELKLEMPPPRPFAVLRLIVLLLMLMAPPLEMPPPTPPDRASQ